MIQFAEGGTMKKKTMKILCVVFLLMACLLNEKGTLAQESKLTPEMLNMIDKLAADPAMHNKLGLSYARNGKEVEAIESFTMAIKLKPDYAEAYVNLGKVYHGAGDLQTAINAYKKAIEAQPDYSEAYGTLGYAYLQSNNYQDAINVSKKAIRVRPQYAEAHLNLGIAYLMTNRDGEARKEYTILQRLDPAAAKQLGAMIDK
jgi:protein O-GlcNAc transferase